MEVHHEMVYAALFSKLRPSGEDSSRIVLAELCYDSGDPYAVTVDLDCGSNVRWLIGRDLLVDGMFSPVGEGNVRVSPAGSRQVIVLALSSPDGEAVLEVAAVALGAFLAGTFECVAAGEESAFIDFDTEIAKLRGY
ncbi:SsgA family sporulation/cell division regulator [Kutzneria buriramensis]|uniref:Sporulation and cell division protein SsgA n=1 Tax=Kutzneria buriramensis TaxID=1045776 RepID=A0A3E0GUZ9_9PSEU|nr:SsgA family sporulation/cell division regulator [Kutzneria buriramensis]REH28578.1 sporulation and cell division protein SsgA [Kutzneria buriramensis]